MSSILGGDEFDAAIWIFLNHGHEGGLGMDQGELKIAEFQGLFSPLDRPKREKDVLVILDSCEAGRFAQAALGGIRPQRLWILTASPKVCQTTAVIFTRDEDWRKERLSDARFLILSPMFSRRLLNTVAYTRGNPTLSQIPGILNGPPMSAELRGFEAELYSSGQGDPWLRDFFRKPVRPDSPLSLYGRWFSFDEVLPCSISRPLFDDFSASNIPLNVTGPVREFVEVAPDPTTGFSVKISGILNPNDPAHAAILQEFKPRMSQGIHPGEGNRRAGAWRIITSFFAKLKEGKMDDALQGRPDAPNSKEIATEIIRVFREVDGLAGYEVEMLVSMVKVWTRGSMETWRQIITDIRDEIVADLEEEERRRTEALSSTPS
jgi:hypothetical protein